MSNSGVSEKRRKQQIQQIHRKECAKEGRGPDNSPKRCGGGSHTAWHHRLVIVKRWIFKWYLIPLRVRYTANFCDKCEAFCD